MLRSDRGSAAVDFVLVGSLVTLLFLAIVQLGIDYHVRNVMAACVAEGARYGANADVSDPQAGAGRANDLIRESLGGSFAHATADRDAHPGDGRAVITLTPPAPPPLLAGVPP